MPYMVTFTINIPPMLAYIYHTWILWDIYMGLKPVKCPLNQSIGVIKAGNRNSNSWVCGGTPNHPSH